MPVKVEEVKKAGWFGRNKKNQPSGGREGAPPTDGTPATMIPAADNQNPPPGERFADNLVMDNHQVTPKNKGSWWRS